MKVEAIKTAKIGVQERTVEDIFREYLPPLPEQSIVAITSKVIALCEGNIVPLTDIDKDALIQREADWYLPKQRNKYDITITVKDNIIIPTAGIDESNAAGYYVLWPKDAQATANRLRAFLQQHYGLKEVGVVITDSTTQPMRRGTGGIAIAHSGFRALRDYIGTTDIYGRELKMTLANVRDALASSAVLCMGEGDEQQPLALITEAGDVEFVDHDPSLEELEMLSIEPDDDIFAQILQAVDWQPGGSGKK